MAERLTLEPCPFCGGKAVESGFLKSKNGMRHISCTECRASSAIFFGGSDEMRAAWNRRASLSDTSTREGEVFLRTLIDLTWQEALEDTSVPSGKTQDRLIERTRRAALASGGEG